jgi:hypothetical protein
MDGESMSRDPIAADFSALEALKRQLLDLGISLDNMHHPLGIACEALLGGIGQFADQVRDGATEFLLAWRVALGTMSDGVSIVGNSAGKSIIDLSAIDTVYSDEIIL